QLFAQCRTGHVAVLIGSTAKMGVGTNIQARAVHLVDMDAPWRPADVEQRHGRILRQGNQNPEVQISQVVTVGSFDTYMWQTLERKARFIGQVMAGTVTDRETGDIGADELQYAEVKALSSGNPMLLELAQAEQDLSRYRRLEQAHRTNQWNLRSTATVAARTLEDLAAKVPVLEAAAARTVPTKGDAFRMRISGRDYTKRPEAAAALDAWAHAYGRARMCVSKDFGPVVEVGGHSINVSTDGETVTWTVEDAPTVRTRDPLRDILAKPVELGHITRLENLPGRIAASLANDRFQAQDFEQRLAQAEAGLGKPFQYAQELGAAEARYDDITAAMASTRDEPVLVSAEATSALSSTDRAARVSGLLAETRAKLADPQSPARHQRPERSSQIDHDRGLDRG
ncbi:MAG TPA: helicase C-terminal domain-containing protein, partial [Microlunatus sp.]